jgi:cation:H+ antiporter
LAEITPYAFLIIGLILLSGGADYLVRGAVSIATALNISPLVVGLTIIAFGTSLPELVVCVRAASAGAAGLAVGNVVGSNIANILLVLGAGSMVDMDEVAPETAVPMMRATLWVITGIIGVAIGAELLISSATTIARSLGVGEEVIGLTMVAVGTSLPELATVIAAATKRQSGLIVGNVIGSNIFNILGVMGVTATVADIPVGGQILTFDIWVMAAAAIVLVSLILSGSALNRRKGTVFLALYAAYIAIQYAGVDRII